MALLDVGTMDGQAPVSPDAAFQCQACATATPVRYVVFPRSELNRVSGSAFSRAWLQITADELVVRTDEAPSTGGERADALYAFSPSLELRRASFSDRYWEMHRAHEVQHRLDHSREQCPDRDGPRAIEVWEPQTGWQTVEICRAASHSRTSLASRPAAQK